MQTTQISFILLIPLPSTIPTIIILIQNLTISIWDVKNPMATSTLIHGLHPVLL